MTKKASHASNERTGATQARGRVRRDLLIQSAKDLLEEKPLEDISLADIAERAGIPTPSAYHSFPNAHGVMKALGQRFGGELDSIIRQPYRIEANGSWRDILERAIDRSTDFYAENPGYRQLIIGGQTPPEIKLSDRGNDEVLAQLLRKAIGQHFVLPDFPNQADVFFYAVEIIDLFFMLSMMRENEISAAMAEEAKRASYAYLRVYLPRELPRRIARDQ